MKKLRRLTSLLALVLGLLAAAGAAAQSVTIGGENADVFFAIVGADKKVKAVKAESVSPSGQVTIPPGVISGLKQHKTVKVYYRRNKCTHKKELIIVPPDMTPEQIAEFVREEQRKAQDCGGFLLLPQDVPWGPGTSVTIDFSGETPTVSTSSSAVTTGATHVGTGGTNLGEFRIDVLPGIAQVNGNNGVVVNAGGGFVGYLGDIFGLGFHVSGVGGQDTTTFSVPKMTGGGSMGSTFASTSVREVGAQAGGTLDARINKLLTLGLTGGLAAENLHVNKIVGICVATCFVVDNSHRTAQSPGYYGGANAAFHVTGPLAIVAQYEYERPGTLKGVNIHYNKIEFGTRFTFGVKKPGSH